MATSLFPLCISSSAKASRKSSFESYNLKTAYYVKSQVLARRLVSTKRGIEANNHRRDRAHINLSSLSTCVRFGGSQK